MGITRQNAFSEMADLSCYSNKIDSVCLRRCPYNHLSTHKQNVYFSARPITVTNISRSFYLGLQGGCKNQLKNQYGTKLRHCHPIFSILLSACEFDKFVYFRICQNVTNKILAVNFTMQLAGQTGGCTALRPMFGLDQD